METELDLDLLRVFEKEPGSLELYLTLEQRLQEMLPAMRRKVGKTETAFYLRHRFGSASLLAVRRKAQRPSPLPDGELWPKPSPGKPPGGRQDGALPQPVDPPRDDRLGGGDRPGAAGLAVGGPPSSPPASPGRRRANEAGRDFVRAQRPAGKAPWAGPWPSAWVGNFWTLRTVSSPRQTPAAFTPTHAPPRRPRPFW